MGLIFQGKSTFISQGGLNQLNNFIFVLAIMQIVYSVLTMALGRAKVCAHSLLLSILGSQFYLWCFNCFNCFLLQWDSLYGFHAHPMGHNTS